MYGIKKIEFEIKDSQHVDIIAIDETGTRKEVGHIFSPSGSGENHVNAIQICGFTEAFDLWGCGVYAMPKYDLVNERWIFKKKVKLNAKKDDFAEVESNEKEMEQVKDIQLKFDWNVEDHHDFPITGTCHKCFNEPCTCEVKVRFENPYTVKRAQDLHLEEKEEEINNGN